VKKLITIVVLSIALLIPAQVAAEQTPSSGWSALMRIANHYIDSQLANAMDSWSRNIASDARARRVLTISQQDLTFYKSVGSRTCYAGFYRDLIGNTTYLHLSVHHALAHQWSAGTADMRVSNRYMNHMNNVSLDAAFAAC
jgi:hypothetical protein